MKAKGLKFYPGQVTEWLDCGNKNATVYTNQRVLEFDKGKPALRGNNITSTNSVIIEPCYLGDNVVLNNAVVGPHVSIGANSVVTNSVITDSILQTDVKITSAVITKSMVGTGAEVTGKAADLSVSDYSQVIA